MKEVWSSEINEGSLKVEPSKGVFLGETVIRMRPHPAVLVHSPDMHIIGAVQKGLVFAPFTLWQDTSNNIHVTLKPLEDLE